MVREKNTKRGLAPIVSAVLLILMTIFAAGIVVIGVKKSIDVQSSPEFSCLEIKLEQVADLRRACFSDMENHFEVGVYLKNEDFLVEELGFVFDDGTGQNSLWECSEENGCTILEQGQFANYYFRATDFEDSGAISDVSFYINNCEIEKMKVGVC
ncbi:hypothetical protein HN604_03550 [archaeon]|jgi:flagellin-like protein|nr:hypothetical protein [archaeon]MBT6182893.1 hypothetical protein [archaeon]MBT6606615.1 hypothetical protein [archaeon]MBT7251858.1 hypothetical protein [archaeon]MBT7661128.1 hypothetical protein [archaeon]